MHREVISEVLSDENKDISDNRYLRTYPSIYTDKTIYGYTQGIHTRDHLSHDASRIEN